MMNNIHELKIGDGLYVTKINGESQKVPIYVKVTNQIGNVIKFTPAFKVGDFHCQALIIGEDEFYKEDEEKDSYKADNDVDLVNHPAHYTTSKIEVIDILEDLASRYDDSKIAYLIATAGKYLFRAPFKGKLLEDLKKAQWYLNKAIDSFDEN